MIRRQSVKRRIFISFDHEDTAQVNGFLGLRNILDNFDFYNHKLDHRVKSDQDNYVKRVIREQYITPASVTVVLIGNRTADSPWVKWEIGESKNQAKGILGIRLPGSTGRVPSGIPANAAGGWQPDKFAGWIEWAFKNRPRVGTPFVKRNPMGISFFMRGR
jgi:hypothetical protein